MLLVYLLMYRHGISIEVIERECKVTPRTAFRYINALEKIGLPIYYDRLSRTYRLLNHAARFSQLVPAEAALLVLALNVLEFSISPRSLDLIKRVRVKLESFVPPEEQRAMLKVLEGILDRSDGDQLRSHVIITLVEYAQRLGRKVRLEYSGFDSGKTVTEIERPTLRFERGWLVQDTAGSLQGAIPIGNIIDLEVL
ncbi:MAG: hypothetical protein IT585_03595 [candidate division Zixibacteria bacterium]|nr:hypothetical protein [candidate division Zixibacteria bacterium]